MEGNLTQRTLLSHFEGRCRGKPFFPMLGDGRKEEGVLCSLRRAAKVLGAILVSTDGGH